MRRWMNIIVIHIYMCVTIMLYIHVCVCMKVFCVRRGIYYVILINVFNNYLSVMWVKG